MPLSQHSLSKFNSPYPWSMRIYGLRCLLEPSVLEHSCQLEVTGSFILMEGPRKDVAREDSCYGTLKGS